MRPDSEYQFASDEKNLRSGAEVYLKGYKGYKSVLAQYSGKQGSCLGGFLRLRNSPVC